MSANLASQLDRESCGGSRRSKAMGNWNREVWSEVAIWLALGLREPAEFWTLRRLASAAGEARAYPLDCQIMTLAGQLLF
jgi:hypothetical protein